MEAILYPDLPAKLNKVLRNVYCGRLPHAAADFAHKALEQVHHLHVVIEELEALYGSTDGPIELLREINGEANRYLYWCND